MKSRSSLLIALFVMCAIVMPAQNKNFEWGNNLSLENNLRDLVYADSLGNAYFSTENKEGDNFIEMQKLHDSKSTFSTKIRSGKSDFSISRTYPAHEGISFIGTEYDKKTSQIHYKQNVVDWNGNLKSAEPKEFLIIDVNKKNGLGSTHVCISSDHSKIIITYREPEAELMMLYCFDENFNKLFEKQAYFHKNSSRGLIAASDFLVSNSGDFIFQEEKIKITKRNGDWESVEDWIFTVPFESTISDSTLLRSGLSSLGYSLDNRQLVIFGTTFVKGTGLGTYFCIYDIAQKKLSAETSSALTADLFVTPGALDNNKGKPFLPRSSVTILRMPTGYYVVMDAGSMQASSGAYGMSSVMINMVNCNILSISLEGKTNWIATIFRDQVGAVTQGQLGLLAGGVGVSTGVSLRSDDFSLYGMGVKIVGDELLFFMNDDVKNTPQPSSNKAVVPVRKSKQLSACLVHVSKDGKITKELVSGTNGEMIRWHASYNFLGNGYLYAFFDGADNAGGVLVR